MSDETTDSTGGGGAYPTPMVLTYFIDHKLGLVLRETEAWIEYLPIRPDTWAVRLRRAWRDIWPVLAIAALTPVWIASTVWAVVSMLRMVGVMP